MADEDNVDRYIVEPKWWSTALSKPFQVGVAVPRGEINNIDLRSNLLEVARLLDYLAPDSHDPERYFLQKSALVHELRRLARWAKHAC